MLVTNLCFPEVQMKMTVDTRDPIPSYPEANLRENPTSKPPGFNKIIIAFIPQMSIADKDDSFCPEKTTEQTNLLYAIAFNVIQLRHYNHNQLARLQRRAAP
jgi:hypothetical protein